VFFVRYMTGSKKMTLVVGLGLKTNLDDRLLSTVSEVETLIKQFENPLYDIALTVHISDCATFAEFPEKLRKHVTSWRLFQGSNDDSDAFNTSLYTGNEHCDVDGRFAFNDVYKPRKQQTTILLGIKIHIKTHEENQVQVHATASQPEVATEAQFPAGAAFYEIFKLLNGFENNTVTWGMVKNVMHITTITKNPIAVAKFLWNQLSPRALANISEICVTGCNLGLEEKNFVPPMVTEVEALIQQPIIEKIAKLEAEIVVQNKMYTDLLRTMQSWH
jgi:hypothetical protein